MPRMCCPASGCPWPSCSQVPEDRISRAEAEELTRLEAAADARFEEERVGIRWQRASLEVVRQAADLAGVPYQTYVKQVAFRQALTDLKDAAAVGVPTTDASAGGR